jgi:hypothetical protein
VLATTLVACTDDDDDASDRAPATSVTAAEVTAPDTTETAATEAPGSTAAATTTAAATAPAPTTPPTTPPTTAPVPVPGATSADPACRAAGEFFSSLNALLFPLSTSDVVGDPESAADYASLEVLAAPSLLGSAQALEAGWPAPAAGELAGVKAGFLDPFTARLQAAAAELTAAGVTSAELETMADTWRATVATGATAQEISNLEPQDLGVPAALATKVEQAGQGLLESQGALLESPVFAGELVTYPQLEQHLAGACPEVADLVASNF